MGSRVIAQSVELIDAAECTHDESTTQTTAAWIVLFTAVKVIASSQERKEQRDDTVDADRELKAKHRALWASGDYPAVAAELIPAFGPEIVRACGVKAGDRVLDIAAGSGNSAIPAAEAGAIVTASDLTPELFEAGRGIAASRGVELEWVEADAEALPFADDSYDVVMSTVGVMFAPHHQAAADELIRVCRPGGTIGLINWTPQGFIGNLFKTMKPYAPPPPPGASPAPLWGDEDHVRELFGDRVTDLELRRQEIVIDHSPSPWSSGSTGSATTARRSRRTSSTPTTPRTGAALDRDFLAFLTEWNTATEPGKTAYHAEYLLVTGTKSEQ